MKSGQFIKTISVCYGVEASTAKVFDRALKEAGLMTGGKGGRGAPDVKPEDLAVFTLALLGTDKPAQAVEMVNFLGSMQLASVNDHPSVSQFLSDPDHTFRELMNVLCDPNVPLRGMYEITFERGIGVVIEDIETGAVVGYAHREAMRRWHEAVDGWEENPDLLARFDVEFPSFKHGIKRSASISLSLLALTKKRVFGEEKEV